MQLEQAFTLAAPLATVWAAFHDVRLLVECLPGASLKDPTAVPAEGADIPLLFQVKLGPIAAGFAGQGRITLDDAAHGGTFAGSAVDAKTNSRVKGEARFSLQAVDTGTRVALTVDHTVTGALAQFSREGIVRALAEQLTRQFADNLQARLPQAPTAATAEPSPDAPVVAPAPRAVPDTSSIDLWTLLKAWLRGLWSPRRS